LIASNNKTKKYVLETNFTQSMAKSFKISFIALMLVILSNKAISQGLFSPRNVVNQYTTVGFGAGSSHYFGDLSPYSTFYNALYTNVRWNVNANYTKYVTPNAALRLQLSWIRILGDDYTYGQQNLDLFWQPYIRNLHFRNDIKEVAISGIFNLIPQIGKGGARNRNNFTPYVTVGLGLMAHDPKATLPVTNTVGYEPIWQSLRQYNTSGQNIPGNPLKPYSLVQAVLPLGLGMRIKVNSKIDIVFEGNVRLTRTDFLDDVGNTSYADITQMGSYSGPNGAALSYRATESFASRKGENRIPLLQQIYSDPTKLNGGFITNNWSPDVFKSYHGPDGSSTKRGSKAFLDDTYATAQFTISYIISDKIKCPVPN
jgi:hypothetical protein